MLFPCYSFKKTFSKSTPDGGLEINELVSAKQALWNSLWYFVMDLLDSKYRSSQSFIIISMTFQTKLVEDIGS